MRETLLDRSNWGIIDDKSFSKAIKEGIISLDDLRSNGMAEGRLDSILKDEPDPILGCMDPEASNFNPNATQDDGSCEYHRDSDSQLKSVQIDFTVDEGNRLISAEVIHSGLTLPFKKEVWTDEGGNEIIDKQNIVCDVVKVDVIDYNGVSSSDTKAVPALPVFEPLKIEKILAINKTDQSLGSISFEISGGASPYEAILFDENNQREIITKTFESGHVQIDDLEPSNYNLTVTDNANDSVSSLLEIQQEVSEDDFESYIKNSVLTSKISDEEVMQELDVTEEELKKIKTQYSSNIPEIWNDMPPRTIPAKTDHWLLGVAGSGKTALLSTLIFHLKDRTLGEDIHSNSRGIKYKNYLRRCMYNQCMPAPTPTGERSFAFMPFDLIDQYDSRDEVRINLIELAGEHVKNLLEADGHLQNHGWVSSPNEKVVSLIIDHDAGYEQEQILIQCINLFESRNALNHVIKLVLIITKVDTLEVFKNATYDEMVNESEKILQEHFPILNTTLKQTVDRINRNNKGWFKSNEPLEFKVLPMTVATKLIRNTFIKDRDLEYISKYSDYIEQGMKTTTIK